MDAYTYWDASSDSLRSEYHQLPLVYLQQFPFLLPQAAFLQSFRVLDFAIVLTL